MNIPKSIFALALVGALVACASPATPTPPRAQPPTAPAASTVTACAATYAVPGADFRSDDPQKLDGGDKPKLVEFYAVW